MDNSYWLDREQTSQGMARSATSSRARLIHYQLAGMYCLRRAQTQEVSRLARRLKASLIIATTKPPPPPPTRGAYDESYFSCLEQGAKYLADRATDPAEREEHMRAAAVYAARAEDAAVCRQLQTAH
jgi:hypothetical protein